MVSNVSSLSLVVHNQSGDVAIVDAVKRDAEEFSRSLQQASRNAIRRLGEETSSVAIIEERDAEMRAAFSALEETICMSWTRNGTLAKVLGHIRSQVEVDRIQALIASGNRVQEELRELFTSHIQSIRKELQRALLEQQKLVGDSFAKEIEKKSALFTAMAENGKKSLHACTSVLEGFFKEAQLLPEEVFGVDAEEVEKGRQDILAMGRSYAAEIDRMGKEKGLVLEDLAKSFTAQLEEAQRKAEQALQALFIERLASRESTIHEDKGKDLKRYSALIVEEFLRVMMVLGESASKEAQAYGELLQKENRVFVQMQEQRCEHLLQKIAHIKQMMTQRVRHIISLIQAHASPKVSPETAPVQGYDRGISGCCHDDGFAEDSLKAYGSITGIEYGTDQNSPFRWLSRIQFCFQRGVGHPNGKGGLSGSVSLLPGEKIHTVVVHLNHDKTGCAHGHTRGVGGMTFETTGGRTLDIGSSTEGLPMRSERVSFGRDYYLAGMKGRALRCKEGYPACAHHFHNVSTFHNVYFLFLRDFATLMTKKELLEHPTEVKRALESILESELAPRRSGFAMRMPVFDPFTLLGLSHRPEIGKKELDKRRRQLLEQLHPDRSLIDGLVCSKRRKEIEDAYAQVAHQRGEDWVRQEELSSREEEESAGRKKVEGWEVRERTTIEERMSLPLLHVDPMMGLVPTDSSPYAIQRQQVLDKGRETILNLAKTYMSTLMDQMGRITSGEELQSGQADGLENKLKMMTRLQELAIRNLQGTLDQSVLGEDAVWSGAGAALANIGRSEQAVREWFQSRAQLILDQEGEEVDRHLQIHQQYLLQEAQTEQERRRMQDLAGAARNQRLHHDVVSREQAARHYGDRQRADAERWRMEEEAHRVQSGLRSQIMHYQTAINDID